MDNWIKNLWNSNKLLFLLLLPLVFIIFFKDLILEYLIGSARKMSNEAQEKDHVLQTEEEKLNLEAENMRAKAAQLGENANNVGKDENWNKKED